MDISVMQGILVGASLLCCMVCLWLVFVFGRRIQTSAYMRQSLVVAAKAEELRILKRDLDDRAISGPLSSANPLPTFSSSAYPREYEYKRRALWEPEHDGGRLVSALEDDYISPSASPEERKNIEDRKEKREEDEKLFSTWATQEKQRYEEELTRIGTVAKKNAEERVPKSMDISILGGGWSFLLEFSTVIVILFILLSLGILKQITGENATTILASIAGYVLGKASASAQRSGGSAPLSPPEG
jgi:hypothetical protein